MVIINPHTGKVNHAQVYDTYEEKEEFDKFRRKIIPEGYIIVAACKDDCSSQLSEHAVEWFERLGSQEILDLGYREGFAFIGRMHKPREAVERRVPYTDSCNVQ